MPGDPVAQSTVINLPNGGTMTMYSYTRKLLGGDEFAAAYADYPPAAGLNNRESVLRNAAAGVARGTGMSLTGSENIDLAGHPGIEFEMADTSTRKSGRARTYLVNNRLYQLIYLTDSSSNLHGERADGFFNSFALISDVDPPATPSGPSLMDSVKGTIAAIPKPPAAHGSFRENSPSAANLGGSASPPSKMRRGEIPDIDPPASVPKRSQTKSLASLGAKIIAFRFADQAEDRAGRGGSSEPDGEPDIHVKLELDLPAGTQIDSIAVLAGQIGHWTTLEGGHWPINGFERRRGGRPRT